MLGGFDASCYDDTNSDSNTRGPMIRTVISITLLASTLCLVACQRRVDPREVLKQETRGKPINQLVQTGCTDMPQDPVFLMPVVHATINDDLDCRLIVDTGAGDALMINENIAEEAQVSPVAEMCVSGIGGESASALSMVNELCIGTIKVTRVMTFTVDENVPLARLADGIIGTGVFADGRVTLDFEHALFIVDPSSDKSGVGSELTVRIPDRKHIFAPLQVQKHPAIALLDSGATHPIFSARWMAANYPDYPRMNLGLPLPRMVAGTDAVEPGANTSVRIELAGRTLGAVPGVVMVEIDALPGELFGEQPDLFLGMTLLRHLRSWTIDFPRQRSWMDWLVAETATASQRSP